MGSPFRSRSMAALWATFFFLALSASSVVDAADGVAPTVYEVLQEYGFPIGLLPTGATSYELDKSTGKFTVHLNSTCSFKIDSYELKYRSTIEGVIAKEKLSKLSGIQVKVLVLWLSIAEVIRDVDELEFSVGIASADFPASNFDECPACGCGFGCEDVSLRKIRVNRPLSSSSSSSLDPTY
ncbi:T31J12.3 PROTEIN-RELATED [Salix purpurea]|uniref:T31J12.3 PROTEIN-RELATED n=1 Tax=Salix purpurea TaxID=77065 RepID=A0A9Q0SRF8_SALPP|nr:T31J12.3 PROTEIN-RELATED [Salix purpurea]